MKVHYFGLNEIIHRIIYRILGNHEGKIQGLRYRVYKICDNHFRYLLKSLMADGNASRVVRLHIQRFPSRNFPSQKLIENIHRRLYEVEGQEDQRQQEPL